MVAQNEKNKKKNKKRNDGNFFLHSWMPIDPRPTHLTIALNSLDSSRTYRRLLESPKPGSSRELFLPENGFKTCYTVYFSKKTSRFGRPENQWKTWNLRLDFYLKRPST